MTGNFEFLKVEWPDLFEAAANAEKYTFTAPRTCAFYCRYTLERTVFWLYDHDSSLKKPYQDHLAAMLHEECFEKNLGRGLFDRIRYIHHLGNLAAHNSGRIRENESLIALRSLFALLTWLVRTYSKNPPADILFRESLIPKTDQQNKQEDKTAHQLEQLQSQLAEKDKQLEEERHKLARQQDQYQKLLDEIQATKTLNKSTQPSQDFTEAQTRDLLIDLLLREAGWEQGNKDLTIEHKVTVMPTPSGAGSVDYVLWGQDGLPLALIEAKRTKRSPEDGEKQAHLYADCLEQTSGQRPIIFYTNGYETWLWDDIFYPPRKVQGFYTKDQLQLLINRRRTRKPLKNMQIDKNIVNRPYHIEGIRRVTEAFEKANKRKALVVMATGSGKTQFSIALVKILMQANWARRVLFLADRITLVRQAKNKFTQYYPDASTVNLLEEKDDPHSRIVFSTYPTMMNLIDQGRDSGDSACKQFGVGHFDLIIIDEAHRSVYLKYRAIFHYFDALLLGLTATPKAEVDRNTYRLFDLENNVPTFYYELDQAVAEHYLVPAIPMGVPLKFLREGIRYNELSEVEKEEYEAHFYDEASGVMPEAIEPAAINQWLFNADTIDKVLAYLMENGLKIQGGDRLGKTIIFAKNHVHALEIKKRFDHIFPAYKGTFMQVIDHFVDFAHQRIDEFSLPDKDPAVAVSVDMLDTGIDIHEIVNLVFFKIVRSKAKFWQMIGRGTRTCPELFGPGQDKENFYIFDFCDNFAYFDVYPEGVAPGKLEPRSQKIFKMRLFLAHHIRQEQEGEDPGNRRLYHILSDTLHRNVQELDLRSFFIRPHRKYVEKYSQRPQWDQLEVTDISDIVEQLSHLMTPADPDEYSRRFDLLILNLQLSIVERTAMQRKLMSKLQELAAALEKLAGIPAVNARMKRIREIRTDRFRQHPSLMELEEVRRELRDLIKFIDPEKQYHVYTDFEDVIGPGQVVGTYPLPRENMANYRRKMEKYIRENENHLTIIKLKQNKPITALDLQELERMLFHGCGSDGSDGVDEFETWEDYRQVTGSSQTFGQFIRSIVGMEREAVKAAFSLIIANPDFSADQISFINQVLDYLSRNGYMEKEALMDQPFSDIHYKGTYGIFSSGEVDNIIHIIDGINKNAQCPMAREA